MLSASLVVKIDVETVQVIAESEIDLHSTLKPHIAE